MKENVIIGKRIPAGTGLVDGSDIVVGSQIEYDALNNQSEIVEVVETKEN